MPSQRSVVSQIVPRTVARAVLAVRAEPALAVAPQLAQHGVRALLLAHGRRAGAPRRGALRARRLAGERDVRGQRGRAVALGQALGDLEGALVELGRLRRRAGARGGRGQLHAPLAGVDLAADGDRRAAVSRVRLAPEPMKTFPETRPRVTDLPGHRRRLAALRADADDADLRRGARGVSHAATPMWSAAVAARRLPMPCVASVCVSSGPDCQLRPVVGRRVVELQAGRGAAAEDGVQAPGGILGEVRLGVVGDVGDLHAGSEGGAVEAAHGRARSRACPRAGRGPRGRRPGAGNRRSRARPAPSTSPTSLMAPVVGAHLRVARGVGEDRDAWSGPRARLSRCRGGRPRGWPGSCRRCSRRGDVLDAEPGRLGVGRHRQRVARPADGLVERGDPDGMAGVEGGAAVGGGELPDLVEARAREPVAVGDDAHRGAVDGDEGPAQRRARSGDRRPDVTRAAPRGRRQKFSEVVLLSGPYQAM